MPAPWKKSYDKPRLHIKKQRHHFADRDPYNQRYGFSTSHVQMCELDHKEGWLPKIWCFWTVVLEKILESPLNCKEIEPVNPKGNQSSIFIKQTDVKLKLQYFGHLIQRAYSLENILMLGKMEGKRKRGWQRDEGGNRGMRWLEIVGWYHGWTWVWGNSEIVRVRKAWGASLYGITKSQTQLSNSTTTAS